MKLKKKRKYSCPKCNNFVSTKHVTKGYFKACLHCDEDFYKFELVNNYCKN